MIVLFTDYGLTGPYLGQVEAVLHQLAPRQRIINLMADVPRWNIKAAAYLLAAGTRDFPKGSVFLCVVDPGVGAFHDRPVAMEVNGCWYVGPDNGLFDLVARRGGKPKCREITRRPKKLSSSFHGRDLYAPVCAMLAKGKTAPGKRVDWQDRHGWPDDLWEVIYIDRFGNCMTGIRGAALPGSARIRMGPRTIRHAATFSSVRPGQAFWYRNSSGLVEIAVNQASAADKLRLSVGDTLSPGRSQPLRSHRTSLPGTPLD